MKNLSMLIMALFAVLNLNALAIDAPQLLEPADSSERTYPIIFKWTDVEDASYYQIQFAKDTEFNYVVGTLDCFDNYLNYRFHFVNYCTPFYWRVRAFDQSSNPGVWSNARLITKKKPIQTFLLLPENNGKNVSDTIVFTYRMEISDNFNFIIPYHSFYLEIDTSQNLNSIMAKRVSYQNRTDSFYVDYLLSETQYYWRVSCAVCDDTLSSEIFTFTTAKWNRPMMTKLVSPENYGIDVPTDTTKFQWELAYKAKECVLMVGEDYDFNHVKSWSIKGLPDSLILYTFNVTSLDCGKYYIWKVYSYVLDEIQESETWVFQTAPCTGIANSSETAQLLSPNPAVDYIEITIPPLERGPGGVVESVRVYDLLGVEHPVSYAATPLSYGNLRLDVSGLTPGVYFVRVGGAVQKFVKM